MSKIFYFDLETSGTEHWLHGTHQIAGIIEIDGVEKERFAFNVKLHPAAKVDPKALAVSGLAPEDLLKFDYCEQVHVHKAIIEMLGKYCNKFDKQDKFFLCAYNGAAFDLRFFLAFFKQCGDDYFFSWFWSACLDVMILASQYLREERHLMENFKQKTVARHFGIEVDESKLHDAVYDVEIMIQIYKFMFPI